MRCIKLINTLFLFLLFIFSKHFAVNACHEEEREALISLIEGGVTPLQTPEDLKAMGFHLILHPLIALYASARALIDVLKTLKENGTTRDHLHKMATFTEFNQLVKLESWFQLEAGYSNLKSSVGVNHDREGRNYLGIPFYQERDHVSYQNLNSSFSEELMKIHVLNSAEKSYASC